MSGPIAAAVLASLVLFGIGRVLYPSLRLRWLRRQLPIAEAQASAASELAVQQALESAERIAVDLESGAITENAFRERDAAAFAAFQQTQHSLHPVYLRCAQLRGEFWRRAPRREVDAEIRRLDALLADATVQTSRFESEMLLKDLRRIRETRDLELP
jgi:hypothetical protein